jgi:hypothetical protein
MVVVRVHPRPPFSRERPIALLNQALFEGVAIGLVRRNQLCFARSEIDQHRAPFRYPHLEIRNMRIGAEGLGAADMRADFLRERHVGTTNTALLRSPLYPYGRYGLINELCREISLPAGGRITPCSEWHFPETLAAAEAPATGALPPIFGRPLVPVPNRLGPRGATNCKR